MMASGEIRLAATTMRRMPVLAQSGGSLDQITVTGQKNSAFDSNFFNPNFLTTGAGGQFWGQAQGSAQRGGTVQVGVSAAGKLIINGVLAFGIAADESGSIGLYYDYGGGFATSPDLAISVFGHVSNAATIQDLAGPFYNVNVGGGWGPHATGDGFWGTGTQGQNVLGTGFSVGAGAGGASSATRTTTTFLGTTNFWSLFLSTICWQAVCGP